MGRFPLGHLQVRGGEDEVALANPILVVRDKKDFPKNAKAHGENKN